LRVKFDDYVLEEERKAQVAQLQAEEKGEKTEVQDGDFGKDEFYTVYTTYKEKKKAAIDERNSAEATNLQEKKALISRLREIVTTEENIGSAFAAFKEIQDKWKEVGDIPRSNRNDIQAEYSRLLEDFFYNIKIYKELKDHDFHRNYQLKVELIEKLKKLIEVKNIRDVEGKLKALQNNWDEIGPVPNEKWDEIKDAYWTEVRSIYERINRFYDDRRIQQQENLKLKEQLVEEVGLASASLEELDNVKAWDEKTAQILEIQKKWKTIGFGPKKENDAIWKTFRAICDTFFNAKKEFFGKIHEEFDGIAAKKKELIDKANALKVSTDWKETSNQLIQLQKQWKQLGHAGRKHEQKLWKAFRGACDNFFTAKQDHFNAQDKAYEGNLTAKQDLLKEIEAYQLPSDKKEALNSLKEYTATFNAIGRVPMKDKDTVFKAFKAAMDKHYGDLKLEGAEKERVFFEAKLETFKASPNSSRLLGDLKQDLRKDIDKQQKEINLLENNLGFFANSKGADALKKDVEKKVDRAKEKIEAFKRKIKMIPNE
ncbi:MAG: DUF349 domain-containing protein, partial [Crocinitomicaceae bacterium]|nr:DUF349 domain-containing protein [Crocinitomicaceae bacterium]